MSQIKVVIVDDHHLIRDAVRTAIAAHPTITLVAEGCAGEDVATLVEMHHPDVLVLDQSMPHYHDPAKSKKFHSISGIEEARRLHPNLRIIILSMWMDAMIVQQTMQAGASGYISKSDPQVDIGHVIQLVVDDGIFFSQTAGENYFRSETTQLTPRQVEVVAAINRNPVAPYTDLAAELGLSESTFKKHLTLAMKRLGVPNNKLAAIKLCEKFGLI